MKQQPVPADYALGVTESGLRVPDTFVLKRGNPHVSGEKVEPTFPRILDPRPPRLSPPQAKTHSSGRRLTLANWIASPDNPATARVMVNRIWQHHFGRGIVRSPNNFGYLGDRPTHPELLDWLAAEFVKNGWQLKSLHRLIMTSSAYRMASEANPAALVVIPPTTCSGDLTCGDSPRRKFAIRSTPSAAASIPKCTGRVCFPTSRPRCWRDNRCPAPDGGNLLRKNRRGQASISTSSAAHDADPG